MVVPNAEVIEGAVDSWPTIPANVSQDQSKELVEAINEAMAKSWGVCFPITTDFVYGYALGLQTARTVLSSSAVLILKGIDPAKVL